MAPAVPPDRRLDSAAADSEPVPGCEAVPDFETAARALCLSLLAARDRTRSELAVALHKRGVPDETGEQVLNRLSDVGLVNDAKFAAAFVAGHRGRRGLARSELVRQLGEKGVSTEIISEAVAGLDEDTDREAARILVETKLAAMTALTSTTKARRLVSMLARKGYSPPTSYSVVQELVGEPAKYDC